jgi:hypothetical protein
MTIPKQPILFELPNHTWRVCIDEEHNTWLSGCELLDGEWVFLTEREAQAAAQYYWLERLASQFAPEVHRQPVEEKPWWQTARSLD